jgi:hypothetical protein
MDQNNLGTMKRILLLAGLLMVALGSSPVDKGFAQGTASFFAPTGISGGGKILSVTTNPQNPAEYLAVCDMMGVYKTVNEGLSWQLIPTDSFAAGHRTQMHYAGTGQNQRIYGIRRFVWGSNRTRPAVSADSGVTWALLAQPTDPSSSDSYLFATLVSGEALGAIME